MHNRYYIVDANDPNMDEIINVSVGELDTQRLSLDGTLMVIKLYNGDHNDYSFLSQYTEYSHEEILPIMASSEWTDQNQE
jgi:hypothetical protein